MMASDWNVPKQIIVSEYGQWLLKPKLTDAANCTNVQFGEDEKIYSETADPNRTLGASDTAAVQLSES